MLKNINQKNNKCKYCCKNMNIEEYQQNKLCNKCLDKSNYSKKTKNIKKYNKKVIMHLHKNK